MNASQNHGKNAITTMTVSPIGGIEHATVRRGGTRIVKVTTIARVHEVGTGAQEVADVVHEVDQLVEIETNVGE